MNKFEQKFIVDPEGNTEKVELSEEEKIKLDKEKKDKKLFRLPELEKDEKREFIVDPEGNTKIEKND
jgi:hypothetical protein